MQPTRSTDRTATLIDHALTNSSHKIRHTFHVKNIYQSGFKANLWFVSGTTKRFCFNRNGYGNACCHDFERPSEGIWHTEQQNSSGKDKEQWFQNNSSKYNCRGLTKFKSQKLGYQFNQNYCIAISIQKISSIHKLFLKIQLILGSHELKRHGYFWPHPFKNHWINF